MKQYKEIFCPNCNKTDLVKNGRSKNGAQRYRCNSCKKSFRLDYTYKAWEPGMKEKIDKQILNSSGVRDTARILKINKNTVISHLKKKKLNK
jgi:transposase-like protein